MQIEENSSMKKFPKYNKTYFISSIDFPQMDI